MQADLHLYCLHRLKAVLFLCYVNFKLKHIDLG